MMFANITDSLPINAHRRPDHPAIVTADRIVAYAELADLVARTAGHLAALGVKERDLVGLALKDSIDHLVLMLAVGRCNAAMLPIDWRWGEPEKNRLVAFFRPSLTVVEDGLPPVEGGRSVTLDAAWHAAAAAAAPMPEPPSRDPDAPYILSLSSGTTGRPKGPMLTHRLTQARFIQHWAALTFNEHDRHLVSTPLYFGGGRMFALSHLFVGATVVLFPLPYRPEELVAAVEHYNISTMFMVPTILRRLMEMPAGDGPLLRKPRYVISGGSVLRPAERQAALARVSANLINYYSSSEGGAVSILLPSHTGDAANSVGRPVFMTEVEIVDDEDRRLPVGEAGIIRYRGPGVPSELYGEPEASAQAFRENWFYPGDLGRMDAGGFLHMTGRMKDMIIRGGVNIYPQDIEKVLGAVQGVHDVAVVGWPSEAMGEEVAAFVVNHGSAGTADLIAHCRAELASYKVPKAIFFVESLPKTTSGKVAKAELVERLKTGALVA
jgi:acyl-CoA synthetase (AMP-forming)/AMP-acid ligase II